MSQLQLAEGSFSRGWGGGGRKKSELATHSSMSQLQLAAEGSFWGGGRQGGAAA